MMEQTPDQASALDDIIEDKVFYTTFFGRSAEYYVERYERFVSGAKATFNPYAFLFGFFWMGYRRMHLELIVAYLIVIVFQCLLLFVFDIGNLSVRYMFNLFPIGLLGCCANFFYFKKADRCVEKAKEMYANTEKQLEYVEKEGGISYIGPIVVGGVLFVAVGMSFFYNFMQSLNY